MKIIPPELIDTAIAAITWHVEWIDLRDKAMLMPAEECKEFLIMNFPSIQGTRNQLDFKKVSELKFDQKNIRKGINFLLNGCK